MHETSHPDAGVILDLDGTLVDSVHQHVVAWRAALLSAGHDVPQWRIHAGIGMGSDRLVPWLLGRHVDGAEAIAEDHTDRFLDTVDQLRPTRGARELLEDLERRGVTWIIATSSGGPVRAALLEVLGRPDAPVTDADGVASSKPAPDLLLTAATQAGIPLARARVVGDSPWDAIATVRAGARPIGVRCGGFPTRVLRDAGAVRVVDEPADLVGQL